MARFEERLRQMRPSERATLRDLLLTQLLSSVSLNATNLGIGLLLLAAAQAMQSGRFR